MRSSSSIISKKSFKSSPTNEFISPFDEDDVEVFAVGSNMMGELGSSNVGETRKDFLRVKGTKGINFKQIYAGGIHSVGITKEGKILSWGCDDDGFLGRVHGIGDIADYIQGELNDQQIIMVACGDTVTMALDSNGLRMYK